MPKIFNLATIIVANEHRDRRRRATYGNVLRAWRELYNAPEADFREELREAMRRGYLCMSITVESRINEGTIIYVTELLGELLALEV